MAHKKLCPLLRSLNAATGPGRRRSWSEYREIKVRCLPFDDKDAFNINFQGIACTTSSNIGVGRLHLVDHLLRAVLCLLLSQPNRVDRNYEASTMQSLQNGPSLSNVSGGSTLPALRTAEDSIRPRGVRDHTLQQHETVQLRFTHEKASHGLSSAVHGLKLARISYDSFWAARRARAHIPRPGPT